MKNQCACKNCIGFAILEISRCGWKSYVFPLDLANFFSSVNLLHGSNFEFSCSFLVAGNFVFFEILSFWVGSFFRNRSSAADFDCFLHFSKLKLFSEINVFP